MRLRAVIVCMIFSLTILPVIPADAQVSSPSVELTCKSNSPSGSVEIPVHPGASLIGSAICTVSNPNSYEEKIEIQATADGLELSYPGDITLAANEEQDFIVTVKADERMTMSSRSLVVKATVVEAQGTPPPNTAESETSLLISILQFSALQVEAVEPIVTLEARSEHNVEFKVYNQGNWVDRFSLELTANSIQEMENAGFTISIPVVNVEIVGMDAPYKARVIIEAPDSAEDWLINSEGQHEKSFTLEFKATSEFSCRYETGGCNSATASTTITVYAEVEKPEEESGGGDGRLGNALDEMFGLDGDQILIEIGVTLVILLTVLFVVFRKTKNIFTK
ncbi:MAG: hypothetical protein DWC02_02385 [Candidatus Poseidoniales archaeon]|nr:MAG: hypothetical protein DWC02_02385 [Candidatus Poseidoniales archaeon]